MNKLEMYLQFYYFHHLKYNSYFQLKNSVEEKLVLVEEKIKSKLISDVDLVQKMTDYHIETGGKRLRALLTLGSAKLCGYKKGGRDINLAACVEMIHGATLMLSLIHISEPTRPY